MRDTAQIRITILHPEEGISPAKCREWLRAEAQSVQMGAKEGDIILIRLYLPPPTPVRTILPRPVTILPMIPAMMMQGWGDQSSASAVRPRRMRPLLSRGASLKRRPKVSLKQMPS